MTDPEPVYGPFASPPSQEPPARTVCTAWDVFDVHQLWRMVEPDDIGITARQVQAWARLEQLCAYTAGRLRQALAQLEHSWPVSGQASKHFHEVVAELAKSMDSTADSAKTNAVVLEQLTTGLAQTKSQVGQLVQAAARIQQGGGQPLPEWINHTARTALYDSEGSAAEAGAALSVPHRYFGVRPGADDGGRPFEVGAVAAAPRRSVSGGQLGQSHWLISKPVLAGGELVGSSAGLAGGAPSVLGGPGGLAGPGVGGSGPGWFGPDGQADFGRTDPYVGAARVGPPGLAGAADGAAPGRGAGRSGMLPPPVGALPPAQPGARVPVAGRPAGYRRPKLDPAHQWYVPTGGPPVLAPEPEPGPHAPGPGVIGIDR